MTNNNPHAFHIEAYDFYGSFCDSVVGIELASRGLRHTFYGIFGYTQDLPSDIEQRELIASELDRKGRVVREVRVWNEGVVEIRFTRSPATRRCVEAWGYFRTKADAVACLSALV